MTQQDLVDSYLLPFQACVEKGKVTSLMCSYNAINGVPSCANPWLLQTVARDAWNFDGYITSDCDADANVYDPHHYTKSPEETVQKVLRAGTDVDCDHFVGEHAQAALDQKLITEDDIDARLKNLFKVRMRLAHFDPPGPLQQISYKEAVCTDAAKAMARDGVAQGATLLKNVKVKSADGSNGVPTLPLDASTLKSVAVIGPNADLSTAISSYYGGNNCGDEYPSMIDAIKGYVSGTTSAKGVPDVSSSDTSGVAAAAAMAKAADATILVLGTDLSIAREGHDAVNLTFSSGQLALVEAVTAAVATPLVVALLTAVPLDLSPLLSNPKVGAILHLGQPSVQTPGAADVLFGVKSPAGRTIQTVYPASYQGEISIFDFNMRPGPSTYARPDCTKATAAECPKGTNPGRTYRFYTGTAIVPFGYGLSYSSFSYEVVGSPPSLSLARLDALLRSAHAKTGTHFPKLADGAQSAAGFEVKVTNTGSVDADDAVLGFLTPPGAGQGGVPLKQLFGFERVHLKAGDSTTVWLYPSLLDFAATNAAGERHALPGQWTASFGVPEGAANGMGFATATIAATMAAAAEA